jgi:uncharacterized protein (DUF362 family)
LINQGYQDEISIEVSHDGYLAVERKLKFRALNFENQEYYFETKTFENMDKLPLKLEGLEKDYSIMLDEVKM